MIRYPKLPVAGMLLFVMLSCGSNKLTSISVSPATADAQNFPSGIVQFAVMGMYSNSSKPTPLTNVTWCIGNKTGSCNGNILAAATIDSSGNAQCVANQTGTVTVLAGSGGMVSNPDGSRQLSVFGSAQLTCP